MTVVNHNYSQRSEPEGGFKSLAAFYPFYLGEHCNVTNRRLHLMGNWNGGRFDGVVCKRQGVDCISAIRWCRYHLVIGDHIVGCNETKTTFVARGIDTRLCICLGWSFHLWKKVSNNNHGILATALLTHVVSSKPATFRYPIWSFICDFKMWSEVMTGKRKF